jgi:hypothetical protein
VYGKCVHPIRTERARPHFRARRARPPHGSRDAAPVPRYVFFMTDGFVGNEGDIIQATATFVQQMEAKGQRARGCSAWVSETRPITS